MDAANAQFTPRSITELKIGTLFGSHFLNPTVEVLEPMNAGVCFDTPVNNMFLSICEKPQRPVVLK